MQPPSSFVQRLTKEFGGRLRIRWSKRLNEFQVEQRVGRATTPPIFVSEFRDDYIRAKDGYAYVLSVRPGDRMPCPTCGLELKVPAFQTTEVNCPRCSAKRNRPTGYTASYFPLGESLIDYLKSIDPERDGYKRRLRDMDNNNFKLEAIKEKDLASQRADILTDGLYYSPDFPKIGYTTSKVFEGV